MKNSEVTGSIATEALSYIWFAPDFKIERKEDSVFLTAYGVTWIGNDFYSINENLLKGSLLLYAKKSLKDYPVPNE